VEQADKLEKIVRAILGEMSKEITSLTKINIVGFKTKFKRNILGQDLIMRVKGMSMKEQADFDRSYYYFKMQVRNHHNSNSFKVKGVNDVALQNMEYLLSRAKQELNVYFVKKQTR